MEELKQVFSFLREDYRVFTRVHKSGNRVLNLLYLPSFRIVLIFRLSQLCFYSKIFKPFAFLLTIYNDIIHGVWIGPKVKVGKGFYLGHPRGLVVNPNTIIGDYCSIIQQVTLGGPCVVIGDHVSINAGAKIISDPIKLEKVAVGNNCIVAAGAVVLKSMPPNSIIAGMPGKVVKKIEAGDWLSRREIINNRNVS